MKSSSWNHLMINVLFTVLGLIPIPVIAAADGFSSRFGAGLLNKTRRDTGYRFSSIARLENPFGWRNYFASAAIIHNRSDSNIDFFAAGSLIGLAAFGYQF